ncbi:hypothetical protein HZU75_03910 [Chitinibacter fontanus]|uniref:Uncharacterized protein n=1 Tax=Chitinibacter fontanus TaxID=1737446 RepID=A0A7D5ZCM3_9NEIS|nr:hypothetical protein [Chitinibacter fontanus]QLI80744.1 hypothetical protein HZU75_03910 [Chitinibacter fontanus]
MKNIINLACKVILALGISSTSALAADNQAFGEATPAWLQGMNGEQEWKTWGVLPVYTRHFDRQAVIDDDLNENNYGLGIERSNGRWHWMLGAYRNSLRDTSVYAQLGWTPLQWQFSEKASISLGAAAGLVSGYQNTDKGYPIVPAGGFLVSLETDYYVGLNLFIVPTIQAVDVEGFVAAQLKFTF